MSNSDVISCPICSFNNCKFVKKPVIPHIVDKIIKNEYSVMQCSNCDYFFVSPRINFTKKEWDILYSEGYFNEMTNWWKNKRQKERNYILNTIQKNSKSIQNFLEIGCGEGYVLIDAQKKGWNVTGIDVYDNRIREAKMDTISFIVGDVLKSNFPSNHFDCIYMDSVLEHVPDQAEYLKELRRILKKDGILYVAVPNEKALIYSFKNFIFKIFGKKEKLLSFQPFLHPYHINGFTTKSLKTMLTKNNFSILKYRNYAGWYEFLKYKFLSKGFIKNFILLPVHLIAIPLRKQFYQDIIAVNRDIML